MLSKIGAFTIYMIIACTLGVIIELNVPESGKSGLQFINGGLSTMIYLAMKGDLR